MAFEQLIFNSDKNIYQTFNGNALANLTTIN
ncbi:protein of unknown function [Paenibacillus alvei]|uniref:Uncharacterized protein n=1 Tax=Paenibacillus alvei TaxID=44250 RepID=A0A383RDG0_PAEAL|nr:protein of unknown function [Paenibacillus alvei]